MKKALFCFFLVFIFTHAVAGTISLSWDPVSDPDLSGYRIYYGTASGSYNQNIDVGNVIEYTLQNLSECTRYYIAVTSYNIAGNESGYSNEVNGLPKPQIVSLSPLTAEQGRLLSVTILGYNYANGATVRTGNPGISIVSTMYVSCTQLQSEFDISETADLGWTDIDVVNPDGIYGRSLSVFEVTPSAPPEVAMTSPSNGADNVALNVHPEITFSEMIDHASVTSLTILLLDGDSQTVPQASNSPILNSAGMVVTIIPQHNLNYSSTYKIKVIGGESGIIDLAGHPMSSDFIQDTGFITVADTTPPVISNVASSNITATSADITWNTDEPADSMVEYKASGALSYTQTTIDPELVTSHTIPLNGLEPDTLYSYHVLSKDESQNSSISSPDNSFTTLADTTPPVISNVASSNITATSADITWNTDEPADSMVEYKASGASSYTQTNLDTEMVLSHTTHLSGLDPETLYYYHVVSKDETANSSISSPDQSFQTSASIFSYIDVETEEGEPTSPMQIGNSTNPPAFSDKYIYTPEGSGQNFTGDPAGKGTFDIYVPATGTYILWLRMYAIDSVNSSFWIKVNTGQFSAIAASVYGSWEWTMGESYYLLAGINHMEIGHRDEQVRADRILITDDPDFVPSESPGSDRTAPNPVASFNASPGDSTNTLTWTNPPNSDLKKTIIRYRDDGIYPKHPNDGFPVCARSANPSENDTYTHTNLTNEKTYYYSTFAIDGDENVSDESMTAGTPVKNSAPGIVRNNRRKDKKKS